MVWRGAGSQGSTGWAQACSEEPMGRGWRPQRHEAPGELWRGMAGQDMRGEQGPQGGGGGHEGRDGGALQPSAHRSRSPS